MNITRRNFNEKLPLITKTIEEADFIAIDGEFTGLSSRFGESDHSYDTLKERYIKIQKGSSDFLLIQFGLSAFHYVKGLDEYSVKTFNFYVFPSPFSRQAPDCRFMCQASSIDFLAMQGFDFNKLFREGIPYLSSEDETHMKEKLHLRHEQTKATSPAFSSPAGLISESVMKSPAVVPDEQKEFIAITMKSIEDFLTNSTDIHLDLPPCTAYQRKLIYQTTLIKFQSKIYLETITLNNRERYIKLSRIAGEAELLSKELSKRQSETEALDQAVGFSKIIQLISKSGKLVVGHNMYLDLIHIVHQFFTPLPQNYDEFKSLAHSLFSQVCDTKLMASMHPFREHISVTVLNDLHNHLEQKPFKKITLMENVDGTWYKDNSDHLHEAGYDAYITGLCFIGMSNYLGTFQSPAQLHVSPSSALLKPFINKMFVMRIADIPYMDLAGKDISPPRNNVFHVRIHDKKPWNMNDIKQLFSATGTVNICWLDERSAYVGIPRENIELMTHSKPTPKCTITPYLVYKANGQQKTRKRSFEDIACPLPKNVNSKNSIPKNQLNVNAVPFVSRSISPIPEEKAYEDIGEDIGEVVSKRSKLDESEWPSLAADTSTNNSQQKSSNPDEKSKFANTDVAEVVFDVPEDW